MSNEKLYQDLLTLSKKVEMLEKYIDFCESSGYECPKCNKKDRTHSKLLEEERDRPNYYKSHIMCANCGNDWITEPRRVYFIG